ncbi:DNA damage-inducible protein 1, partial [Massospora cicadina]
VTVAETHGDIHNLEVPGDMDLDSFKTLLSAELDHPKETLLLFFNNSELRANKTLAEFGIKDDDLLILDILSPTVTGSSTGDNRPSTLDQHFLNRIEAVRNQIITNPRALENLKQVKP